MDSSLRVLNAVDPNKAIYTARQEEYPLQVWCFIVACVATLLLLRTISRACCYAALLRKARCDALTCNKPSGETESQVKTSRRVHLLTKLSLSVLSTMKIVVFRLTFSFGFGPKVTLAEAFTSTAYVAALLTWTFINTRDIVTGENLSYNYWANRSGALATSQVPFVVALAGKNNILSLLTGISYEKLNFLHRTAARALLILSYIHIYARYKIGFEPGATPDWIQAGMIATACLTFLVLFANRYTRSKLYEAFLAFHHFTVAIFLIFLVPHVAKGGYQIYVWPALVLWGIDRFLRFARIITSKVLQHRSSISSKATVELLSSDSLRVTITLRRSALLRWRAGQHAFLRIPEASPFWHPLEFHPFTIANNADDAVVVMNPHDGSTSLSPDVEMKFVIRARDGFTGRLFRLVEDRVRAGKYLHDEQFVSAYVDGPHGTPPNVAAFESVVFIAGGSGVSFTLPQFKDLVRRVSVNPGSQLCRRVLFVWSIRNIDDLDWIASDLHNTLANVPSALEVEVRIFITGSNGNRNTGASRTSKHASHLSYVPDPEKYAVGKGEEVMRPFGEDVVALLRDPDFFVTSGRAGIDDILSDESKRCEDGSMLVVVSGPQMLATAVRSALCKSPIAGLGAASRGTNVTLHVEGFEIG